MARALILDAGQIDLLNLMERRIVRAAWGAFSGLGFPWFG